MDHLVHAHRGHWQRVGARRGPGKGSSSALRGRVRRSGVTTNQATSQPAMSISPRRNASRRSSLTCRARGRRRGGCPDGRRRRRARRGAAARRSRRRWPRTGRRCPRRAGAGRPPGGWCARRATSTTRACRRPRAWLRSCLATAQGGVPNFRGQGICGLPLVSARPVIRSCIASVSALNRSRRAASPATVRGLARLPPSRRQPVVGVAEEAGHHHRGRAARALVGLDEQGPGRLRTAQASAELRLTSADTRRYASSGAIGRSRARRRGRRPDAGRASARARGGPGPAAACGARAGHG